MDVRFEASFAKDLKVVKNKKMLKRIKAVIDDIKSSDNLQAIRNIKKLKGYDNYYRIRLGQYRVGIEIEGNVVILVRFLHRKDVYSFFP